LAAANVQLDVQPEEVSQEPPSAVEALEVECKDVEQEAQDLREGGEGFPLQPQDNVAPPSQSEFVSSTAEQIRWEQALERGLNSTSEQSPEHGLGSLKEHSGPPHGSGDLMTSQVAVPKPSSVGASSSHDGRGVLARSQTLSSTGKASTATNGARGKATSSRSRAVHFNSASSSASTEKVAKPAKATSGRKNKKHLTVHPTTLGGWQQANMKEDVDGNVHVLEDGGHGLVAELQGLLTRLEEQRGHAVGDWEYVARFGANEDEDHIALQSDIAAAKEELALLEHMVGNRSSARSQTVPSRGSKESPSRAKSSTMTFS